ncbi:UDP-N-acetylglucosamine 2-epimerase [Alphaproteobacteria bacterium]|nr:UDP-N-acetylglucosamine 2-epimerase [Alphaproteobacteria bacterium]
MKNKIVFVTGTRADFGKLVSLINITKDLPDYDVTVFVTGMHLIEEYGSTFKEVERYFKENMFLSPNHLQSTDMAIVCSETIKNFHNFILDRKPDLVIIHGDRVETLACATVAALSNVRICHIEGGEVSGTIDESIRHAVSKFSQIHLVCNQDAKNRLIQLGEKEEAIEVLGSPDIDLMFSKSLPDLNNIKDHYEIKFQNYAILIFHPTTTGLINTEKELNAILKAIEKSKMNYVIIYPNNDTGSDYIIKTYKKKNTNSNFRIIPSIEFKSFLVLLKNSRFIIGNSSAGIREAPVYSVPTINVGFRQNNRSKNKYVIDVGANVNEIEMSIRKVDKLDLRDSMEFGDGKSALKFKKYLLSKKWSLIPIQKEFNDLLN